MQTIQDQHKAHENMPNPYLVEPAADVAQHSYCGHRLAIDE